MPLVWICNPDPLSIRIFNPQQQWTDPTHCRNVIIRMEALFNRGLSLSAVFESADRCLAAEQPRGVAFSTSLSKPSTGGLLHPLSIGFSDPADVRVVPRRIENWELASASG